MNRLLHLIVWLSRIHLCRGFGIQSPTDYQFVRYVVNEHWPYYAYSTLGLNDKWLERKLGLLFFRIANWLQPTVVLDQLDKDDYLRAGCAKAIIVSGLEQQSPTQTVDLVLAPTADNFEQIVPYCGPASVMVVRDIRSANSSWKKAVADTRVTISYDLYDCGILMFDPKRVKQHYKINF